MDKPLLNVLLALAAALGACQDGSSPSGKPAELLCPTCVPSAGGQTGDFGGRREPCLDLPPEPVPPEVSEALQLSSVLALDGRALELPFQMERRVSSKEVEVYEPVPNSEISIAARLALGAPGLHVDEHCNMVTIPLTLSLESASGALNVQLIGRLQRRVKEATWLGYAKADLAELRGTLDFGFDRERVFVGDLTAFLNPCADTLGGYIIPYGFYYANRESAEAWAHNDLAGISTTGRTRTPYGYGDDAPTIRATFHWHDEACLVPSE